MILLEVINDTSCLLNVAVECMNGGSKVYAEKIHALLMSGDTFGLASLLLERSEVKSFGQK